MSGNGENPSFSATELGRETISKTSFPVASGLNNTAVSHALATYPPSIEMEQYTMARNFRILLTVLAIALLGLPISCATLNYNGVCIPKGRRMSDEERVRIAVGELIRNDATAGKVFAFENGELRESSSRLKDRAIPYTSVDEFLEMNPGCCTVTMQWSEYEHTPGLARRLTGDFAGYVVIRYMENTLDPDGFRRVAAEQAHLAISNCGAVWDGI